MRTIKIFIATVIISIFGMGVLSSQNGGSEILHTTEITVKQGHNARFIEGVKKWKECYLKHNGKEKWSMWGRQQGIGRVYIMTGLNSSWAEMEKKDEVDNECYVALLNHILPHIEKVSSRVATTMPEVSRSRPEETIYIWVTYYKVRNESSFKNVITQVTEAIKEKEGFPRGLWFNFQLGAPDTPNFMVVEPYKGYADIDIKRDNLAKIYADAVGEEKASKLWDLWYETIDERWSYIYKLNPEMSN
ncbi:hypothetical protein [Salinimicrobium sp. TH3]|uniref:hypothetical protein n=1 Tax=Salinimicrobium sp. TH3 TaxID=2997342 RepID=UPI00227234A9|nr:hypothetical protein [Salinimicrobium sp. TH3]MCY2687609.1 hypothetical protein [Salinimicrobium sp. TH3]